MMKTDMLHSGEPYSCMDEALLREQAACLEALYAFNATRPREKDKRQTLLKELFAEVGEGCSVEPPLYASWGGRHVHFGEHVYTNFSLTLLDDTHIFVGDHTMIGPNVTIATASHPVWAAYREKDCEFNLPVRIGKSCWIGAGALILPGVTIGDRAVIGAGSVVTKDVPADVVAVGNPCHVLREITEKDREFYYKDRPIPPEWK